MEGDLSSTNLDFLKAVGVNDVVHTDHRDFGWDKLGYWDAELIADARRHAASRGIALNMLQLPMQASPVDKWELQDIMTAGPQRDSQIERVKKCVVAAAKGGVPAVKLNFSVSGILRTEMEQGRAGVMHTALDHSKFQAKPTPVGQISSDEMWKRIKYWVDAVLPVADELKVRVACHPHDPTMPLGMGLDDRVLGTISGLKKYVDLNPSPYHGLNYCQGCMEESGATKQELLDAIRYFGSRKKLFLVHFRTIIGTPQHFREAFIDEGDMDMMAAMQAYQDIGYENLIVPDHYPQIPNDKDRMATRAYAIGFIKAMIRATGGER
jgi:mannonate dehydratase